MRTEEETMVARANEIAQQEINRRAIDRAKAQDATRLVIGQCQETITRCQDHAAQIGQEIERLATRLNHFYRDLLVGMSLPIGFGILGYLVARWTGA